MSNLIDCVYNANEKINIKLASAHSDDQIKIITTKDIPSVVELYRSIFKELSKVNCEKFIHNMGSDDVEELISHNSNAMIGYFKDGKHLAGALYAKPFSKSSPFFQTPTFEGDKTTYAIGGLAVDPNFRGNGIVGKMTSAAVEGVQDYATNFEQSIGGAGIEVSCENFGSLRSLGAVKDCEGQTLFNFAGIHYLEEPEHNDNDLTVLGYKSFMQDATTGLYLPSTTLNASQTEAFDKLTGVMDEIGSQADGVDIKTIDGHNIATFANYIDAPINQVINYDSVYATTYPPQLSTEPLELLEK